jgi:hypothetical protein
MQMHSTQEHSRSQGSFSSDAQESTRGANDRCCLLHSQQSTPRKQTKLTAVQTLLEKSKLQTLEHTQ